MLSFDDGLTSTEWSWAHFWRQWPKSTADILTSFVNDAYFIQWWRVTVIQIVKMIVIQSNLLSQQQSEIELIFRKDFLL